MKKRIKLSGVARRTRIYRISRGVLVAAITTLTLAIITSCGTAGGDASNGSKNQQTIGEKDKTTEEAVGGNTQIANPWHEASESEAAEKCAHLFKLPDGATDVTWRVMDQNVDHPMVEAKFKYGDTTYFARAQETDNGEEDISGVYMGGADKDVTLASWNVQGKNRKCIGEDNSPDLNILYWYDSEVKTNYSLYADGLGVAKIDIAKIADKMK